MVVAVIQSNVGSGGDSGSGDGGRGGGSGSSGGDDVCIAEMGGILFVGYRLSVSGLTDERQYLPLSSVRCRNGE